MAACAKRKKNVCKKKKKTMDLEKYFHWSKAITDLISRQSLTFHQQTERNECQTGENSSFRHAQI